MVDPRVEPRPYDPRAFNSCVLLLRTLASGLLTAGARPERILWISSQCKGRSVVLGERIIQSYSAGSPFHLIMEAPQNKKAFGDSKNVFTTHKPYVV